MPFFPVKGAGVSQTFPPAFQVNNISRSVLMTCTAKPGDSKDSFQEKGELFERDDKRLDKLYEDDEYELDLNSANDREMVKNLD